MIANFQMLQRQATESRKKGEIIGVGSDGTPIIRAESPPGKKRSKKSINSTSKKERAV